MYKYAEVQTALAKLHSAFPDHMGAFRGRLQHFQRLGMAPSSPGRGKVILYGFEDVARWAFGLELVECGIDPTRIVSIMSWAWLRVGPTLCNDHEGDKVFCARPAMMITQMREWEYKDSFHDSHFLPVFGRSDVGNDYVFDAEALREVRPGRALIISLTELRDRLKAVLAEGKVDEAYAAGSFK